MTRQTVKSMTVRQKSDLIEDEIVGERTYSYVPPNDLNEMLRLILNNCADFMNREGILLHQDSIELVTLTLKYPGLAGALEVLFETESTE